MLVPGSQVGMRQDCWHQLLLGLPGVTLVARTPVCQSMRRGFTKTRWASLAISPSKPGISLSMACK